MSDNKEDTSITHENSSVLNNAKNSLDLSNKILSLKRVGLQGKLLSEIEFTIINDLTIIVDDTHLLTILLQEDDYYESDLDNSNKKDLYDNLSNWASHNQGYCEFKYIKIILLNYLNGNIVREINFDIEPGNPVLDFLNGYSSPANITLNYNPQKNIIILTRTTDYFSKHDDYEDTEIATESEIYSIDFFSFNLINKKKIDDSIINTVLDLKRNNIWLQTASKTINFNLDNFEIVQASPYKTIVDLKNKNENFDQNEIISSWGDFMSIDSDLDILICVKNNIFKLISLDKQIILKEIIVSDINYIGPCTYNEKMKTISFILSSDPAIYVYDLNKNKITNVINFSYELPKTVKTNNNFKITYSNDCNLLMLYCDGVALIFNTLNFRLIKKVNLNCKLYNNEFESDLCLYGLDYRLTDDNSKIITIKYRKCLQVWE